MDWLGSITIVSGLVLLVFAITDSSHGPRGWPTPYIYVTFVVAFLMFGVAFYIEGWVADQPLLPFGVFRVKYVYIPKDPSLRLAITYSVSAVLL
jgi:hypothetical protein